MPFSGIFLDASSNVEATVKCLAAERCPITAYVLDNLCRKDGLFRQLKAVFFSTESFEK